MLGEPCLLIVTEIPCQGMWIPGLVASLKVVTQ